MWKIVLIALVLAVCAAEARRGGKGNRRGGGGAARGRGRGVPSNAENVSMWNRTLVNEQAKEVAFTLPDNTEQVYFVSGNKRQLKKENYQRSKVLYDFTGGVSRAILKVKKWCFLLDKPEDLTKEAVLQETASFNGQTRPATTPVAVYVSDLDDGQTTELQGRSAVSAMCGSKPIKALTTTAPADSSAASRTYLATTLDEQISIKRACWPQREGRRPGRGRA